MGGDPGAVTIANLVKLYNPNVVGASLGDHRAEICYASWCPPFQYFPDQDQLNAAQSGATVSNLNHEIEYLAEQLKITLNVDMENDFKVYLMFNLAFNALYWQ